MDSSSKLFGTTEECSSTESGWTMYIASPTHDDDDNHSDVEHYADNDDDGNNDNDDGDDDDDSDDSMASDASSGPSHQGNQCGITYFNKDEEEEDNDDDDDNDGNNRKYFSHNNKNVIRNMRSKGDEGRIKINVGKKESSVDAKTVASSTTSTTKVRKPRWFSKSK